MDMNLGPKVHAFMYETAKANHGITTEALGAMAEEHFGNLNASGFQPHQILQMAETVLYFEKPHLITYERQTTCAKEKKTALIMTARGVDTVLATFYGATYQETSNAAHAYRESAAGRAHMVAAVKNSPEPEATFFFSVARI